MKSDNSQDSLAKFPEDDLDLDDDDRDRGAGIEEEDYDVGAVLGWADLGEVDRDEARFRKGRRWPSSRR